MIYEYHTLIVSDKWLTSHKGGDANEALDRLGAEGYDIGAALTLDDGTHVLIMRRSYEPD